MMVLQKKKKSRLIFFEPQVIWPESLNVEL